MAYLIEETKGRFPTWLAPVQVKVMPITDRVDDYAKSVARLLDEQGFRVETDLRNEKIGYKIREARSIDRVPYMVIVGEKEAEEGTISVRDRTNETHPSTIEDFCAKVREEIRTRA